MLTLRSFLLLLFLFPLLLQAGAAEWKTNYEEALKESARSGKPVLAEFTGSDTEYIRKCGALMLMAFIISALLPAKKIVKKPKAQKKPKTQKKPAQKKQQFKPNGKVVMRHRRPRIQKPPVAESPTIVVQPPTFKI